MTEKIRPYNNRHPHAIRAAVVLAGTVTVGIATVNIGSPRHLNFDPAITTGTNYDTRVTPSTCHDSPTAVGAPLTESSRTIYLGILGDDTRYADAVRVEGTRQQLTVTPLEGPERTIFANAIPPEQVIQLPLEHDDMLLQIGRGPGAGSDERMVVAVGCNQSAIDRQFFFYEHQEVVHVPPMKERQ